MDEFSFYFSFFGLLLGLSVAEAANGLANAIANRRKIAMGILTPLLALFVLLDISSFWLIAWVNREHAVVGWTTIFSGLAVAITYYLSAALIFPRSGEEYTSLDDHYWNTKRFVFGGIFVANLVLAGTTITLAPPDLSDPLFWGWQIAYWLPLTLLLFSRTRRVDLILLGLSIGQFVVLASGLVPYAAWANVLGL